MPEHRILPLSSSPRYLSVDPTTELPLRGSIPEARYIGFSLYCQTGFKGILQHNWTLCYLLSCSLTSSSLALRIPVGLEYITTFLCCKTYLRMRQGCVLVFTLVPPLVKPRTTRRGVCGVISMLQPLWFLLYRYCLI